jgi:hypothetical protein
MDADERLQLDYDQTTQLLRTLTDVRFRLLAFVPTISGVTVAFFGKPRPAVELLAVGILGGLATLGIFLYELRNSQILDALVHRASELEARLGFVSASRSGGPGGPFTERPGRTVRFLGLITVGQDRGVALVYGAALSGWSYLVAWGALRAFEVDGARKIAGVIAALAGALVIAEVHRIEHRPDKPGTAPAHESSPAPEAR